VISDAARKFVALIHRLRPKGLLVRRDF